jgi:probable phosphoglycerate mutase
MFSTILFLFIGILPQKTALQDLEHLELSTPETQYIYLIRHGESLLNIPDVNGIIYIQGKGESVPLTDKGKEQAATFARQVAKKIQGNQEIAICSSTAMRAQETAKRILEELKQNHNVKLGKSYEGIIEIDQGKWEGLPKDALFHQEMLKWEALSAQEKLLTPRVSTGESYKEVIDRAIPALQEILDEHHGKEIFVVTHHGVMNALAIQYSDEILHLSKEPESKLLQISIKNCDMIVLKIPQNGKAQDAQILAIITTNL